MITVEIEGVKVPIVHIEKVSMNRDNFSTTCTVDYVTERARVTVEVKDYLCAMTLFANIRNAQEKQQELYKLEDAIKHLEYDLKELEKTKLEKLNAYGSLLTARKDLIKV